MALFSSQFRIKVTKTLVEKEKRKSVVTRFDGASGRRSPWDPHGIPMGSTDIGTNVPSPIPGGKSLIRAAHGLILVGGSY